MKTKPLVHLTLVALLALLLVIPVIPARAQAKFIKLGMVNYTLCCSYFIGMSNAVQAEAKPYSNIIVIVTDAKGDGAKLTSDVEDVISKGANAVIISGGPLEAAPAALEALKEAKIPVVLVDRKLKGGDYTSWIGPDNYTIGVQDGKYIVDRLKGQGRLVVVRGGPRTIPSARIVRMGCSQKSPRQRSRLSPPRNLEGGARTAVLK